MEKEIVVSEYGIGFGPKDINIEDKKSKNQISWVDNKNNKVPDCNKATYSIEDQNVTATIDTNHLSISIKMHGKLAKLTNFHPTIVKQINANTKSLYLYTPYEKIFPLGSEQTKNNQPAHPMPIVYRAQINYVFINGSMNTFVSTINQESFLADNTIKILGGVAFVIIASLVYIYLIKKA